MLRPPMVTVPDRKRLRFGSTMIHSFSRPDMRDLFVVIHSRSSLTGQLQSLGSGTPVMNVPPVSGALTRKDDTRAGEVGHVASWLTLTLRPPIVTVPDRSPPEFPCARIVTEPPPDTRDGTDSQPRLSRTDQLQSLRPDTDTLRPPPPAPKLTDDGDTPDGDDGHGARPASWETPTRRPPIVTAPDRPPPEFPCARIVTEPPPDTLDGTDSQPRSPRTDQLQSLRPDTDTLRLPPPAPKLTDDGDTPDGDDGHGARPASWETPTRRPPIVTAPDRPPPEFTCARIVTEPPPDTRDGTDSQPRSSRTDQLQSLRPDTDTLRLPPPAPKPTEDGDTRDGESGHGAGPPACDTLTGMLTHVPRNVTVPVRAAVVGFRDARIVDPTRSTVIQSRSALANKPTGRHGTDVLGATTRTVADPPTCPNRTDRGVTSGSGQ